MKVRSLLRRAVQADGVNFVLTNYVPRRWLTRLVGRLSKSENPFLSRICIGWWRVFSDLDLSEARTTRFRSMHDCFTRQLREGVRPIDQDPGSLTSPSDGIVGACGAIHGQLLLQAKAVRYTLSELLGGSDRAEHFVDGCYATLRLTSSMYHRFHAPHDCRVEEVAWFPGDVWNVNPPTLQRVDKVFCRNERAALLVRLLDADQVIALVPVAAILVASLRLHFLDTTLHMNYRGPHVLPCNARLGKGDEMGWFEHGSTIIVLAPAGFRLAERIVEGARVRVGERLLQIPSPSARK